MKLALDLDMTLNNMAYTWIAWLKDNIDPAISLDKFPYWSYMHDAYGNKADAYWKDPTAYDSIVPLLGAVEFVAKLKTMHNVFIITHTPEGQSKRVKDSWIETYFPDIDVIHSGIKYKHTDDCILIDDHPGHVQRHVRHNEDCYGLIFNHRGNYDWAFSLTDHPRVQLVKEYSEALLAVEKICSR